MSSSLGDSAPSLHEVTACAGTSLCPGCLVPVHCPPCSCRVDAFGSYPPFSIAALGSLLKLLELCDCISPSPSVFSFLNHRFQEKSCSQTYKHKTKLESKMIPPKIICAESQAGAAGQH